jgi:peptide/nickel transport system substrate-binding protein
MDSQGYWDRRSALSRRRLLRGAALAGVGLAGAALVGCGDDDDDGMGPGTPSTGTQPGQTPPDQVKIGGRLGAFTAVNSPNFNPVTNWTEGNMLSGVHVYDRLISPRMDDRVYVLEAAESVELPDETTVVFTLREGMVYQDRAPVNGRAVEAQDIVEMQLYSRDEDQAENRAFQTASMETVEAPDERTVVFTLQHPNAYLFSGTQLGLASNHCIIPRELVLGDLPGIQPIGSGPYQVREAQLDTRYHYERNPTHRRADEQQPYIDEREVFIISDISAVESAFRGERISVWSGPIEIANRLETDLADQVVVTEYQAINPFTWMVSAQREPWQDVRAREAAYRLFNPQPFIDLVDNGFAVPSTGPLAGGLEAYQLTPEESAEYLRFDLAEARQLLDAVGFDFSNTYELITLAGGGGGRNDLAMQVWESQLTAAGIRTTLNGLPFSEWLGPRLGTGNYDFNLNLHPGYDTPQTPLRFHHTDPQHIIRNSNLADPEVDAMIEESELTLDRDANIDLVKRIQIALLERYAPFAQINSNLLKQVWWAYVKDWEFTPATHPMYRTEAWLDL